MHYTFLAVTMCAGARKAILPSEVRLKPSFFLPADLLRHNDCFGFLRKPISFAVCGDELRNREGKD